jgi:hypothetical protein
MVSPLDLLLTKAVKLKKIKAHPGHVLVLGEKGDINFVNVYTMTLLSTVNSDFKGCVNCLYRNKYFILCGKSF